jgi:lipoprotein signal peptidase
VILRFFGELIFDLSQFEYGVWVFAAMFNVAFILFDIAITMIAALYIRRFRKSDL